MKISLFSTTKYQNLRKTDCVSQKQSDTERANTTDLKYMPSFYSPSFGAKTNAQKLAYIGEENFPNEAILVAYKTAIQNGEDVMLCQIHSDFYSGLLGCETLEDSKQLYPEFREVIDAKDIPEEKYSVMIKRIADGGIEGLKLEDLSLELLKRHYGKSNGYARKEAYWGLDPSTVKKLFESLNIKQLNKGYFLTINRETPERRAACAQNAQNLWQRTEYREGRVEDAKNRWQRPEYRQAQVERMKQQWEDPKIRRLHSERMRAQHQNPEYEERRIAAIKRNWADPQRRAELTEINRRCVAARWNDPEARAKMSAIMLEKWKDPEYRTKVSTIISEIMTERWKDPAYIELKTNECRERWANPEFRQHMSDTMRANWQDPEYRQRMEIYAEALREAWAMFPEFTERMSELTKEFPGIGDVLGKSDAHQPLTEKERQLLHAYYKRCHEDMPNFTWIVGQAQKEILALWAKQGLIDYKADED